MAAPGRRHSLTRRCSIWTTLRIRFVAPALKQMSKSCVDWKRDCTARVKPSGLSDGAPIRSCPAVLQYRGRTGRPCAGSSVHAVNRKSGSKRVASVPPSHVPACQQDSKVERAMGIEPTSPAWKAGALPLCYARIASHQPSNGIGAVLPRQGRSHWIRRNEVRAVLTQLVVVPSRRQPQ